MPNKTCLNFSPNFSNWNKFQVAEPLGGKITFIFHLGKGCVSGCERVGAISRGHSPVNRRGAVSLVQHDARQPPCA